MTWWLVKVIAGCLLLALVADYYLFSLMPLGWKLTLPFIPRWLAQGVVCLGGLLNLHHYLILKRQNTNIAQPSCLITDQGLFSYIRHPMYLGDLILYVGLLLLAPSYLAVIVFLFAYYALYRQACVEDEYLAGRFPVQFGRWYGMTKLLFP